MIKEGIEAGFRMRTTCSIYIFNLLGHFCIY
jgi:hypothetical protein